LKNRKKIEKKVKFRKKRLKFPKKQAPPTKKYRISEAIQMKKRKNIKKFAPASLTAWPV
jgi:hypothetical protein